MTADCCEEKALTSGKSMPPSAESKYDGTKHTFSKSKCRQITSPRSVFFSGCCCVKAGNTDKGPGPRGPFLSSKIKALHLYVQSQGYF